MPTMTKSVTCIQTQRILTMMMLKRDLTVFMTSIPNDSVSKAELLCSNNNTTNNSTAMMKTTISQIRCPWQIAGS